MSNHGLQPVNWSYKFSGNSFRRKFFSNHLVTFLIVLIPALGMLSGFSISYMVAIAFLLMFIQISVRWLHKLHQYKLEIMFLIWCVIMTLYGIKPNSSFYSLMQVAESVIVCLLLRENINAINLDKNTVFRPLIYGITIAILAFLVEYFSSGIISRTFRYYFQDSDSQVFFLYYLDRGCAFLSVLSWVLIKLLKDKELHIRTAIVYFIVLLILYLSDSLASFIAYIISGVVFVILQTWPSMMRAYMIKLFTITIIIGSFSLPFIFGYINPNNIVNQYHQIPISAKHRLFIWHFVANKIIQNPLQGAGFNASKYLVVQERQGYHNQELPLLPLHPHNNILQIFLELGVVGALLFLAVLYKYLSSIADAAIYSSFITYYVIGMISYNIWQSWWVFAGLWIYLMWNIILKSVKEQELL